MKTGMLMPFLGLVLCAVLTFAESSYTRYLTAQVDVQAVSVKEEKVFPLVMETDSIVNDEAVSQFSERAVSLMFNARPAKFKEHVESPQLRNLFISEHFYEKWRSQFSPWLSNEFRVQQISIKEAIVLRSKLISSVSSQPGVRFWRYSAQIAVLNRGLGATELKAHRVELDLAYSASGGGMGVFGVRVW